MFANLISSYLNLIREIVTTLKKFLHMALPKVFKLDGAGTEVNKMRVFINLRRVRSQAMKIIRGKRDLTIIQSYDDNQKLLSDSSSGQIKYLTINSNRTSESIDMSDASGAPTLKGREIEMHTLDVSDHNVLF